VTNKISEEYMYRFIVTLLALVAFAGTACAEDVITLPASMGKVEFPHKKHQEMLKDCIKCHEKGPGKIAELGREWAHKTCRGCHTDMKRGPVSCKDCHKK
jgi:hypothetical protein